ncbi:hypothetical protein BDA96_09G069600 [Sorghum bicolor]|uniref:Uncharacterized protein n=2 Tax=Sorghum bicolor TaxID=4558 RepID=A0A921Q922_SORBI|nr:hypothetical protein BDA96_09G069600 [Sorghum bicolor]OQU77550.1 hypothetical protein SORBI_3009G066300 [Sorghum bicolor]
MKLEKILDLKGRYLDGSEISSSSLKRLSIIQCRIITIRDLTISAPNLLSVHCVKPHHRAPLFENLGSLATATVVLDDSFLNVGYEYKYKDIDADALEEGSDSNSDTSLRDDPECDSDTCNEDIEILTGFEDKRCGDDGEDHDHCKHCNCYNHGPYWSGRRYGRRNIFDASQILGGHNVLRSLSNATSLELLADSGEAILNRELKTCPVFRNLKTLLSLGEWCMAADFDSLVSFLRHSPNLERLFLELKLVCVPR